MSDTSVSEYGITHKESQLSDHYSILKGDNQAVEGEHWSTEWMLSEYVQCTDGLIGKMDGSIPIPGLPPPQTVIYLDKSTRPIEWMVKSLWPILARKPGTLYEENQIPEKPASRFLNIDKGDWLRRMGVPEHLIEDATEELIDISALPKGHLARIRALYVMDPAVDERNLDEVWKKSTVLDGQHVMLVDEVKSSGLTLKIAQQLLSDAIPEATFSGDYWSKPPRVALNGGAEIDGKIQYKVKWVPVWYSKEFESGRGISDKDPRWADVKAEKGFTSLRQSRLGRHVLSTPPHDPVTFDRTADTKGDALRKDIEQMAEDLSHHRILYRPSAERPSQEEADFQKLVERIKAVNALASYDEWKDKRDAIKPQHHR